MRLRRISRYETFRSSAMGDVERYCIRDDQARTCASDLARRPYLGVQGGSGVIHLKVSVSGGRPVVSVGWVPKKSAASLRAADAYSSTSTPTAKKVQPSSR